LPGRWGRRGLHGVRGCEFRAGETRWFRRCRPLAPRRGCLRV